MTAVLIPVAFVVGGFALLWWFIQDVDNEVAEDPLFSQEWAEFAQALERMNEQIGVALKPALDGLAVALEAWQREFSQLARTLRRRGL